VRKSQKEKTLLLRLADRYSIVLTIATLAIAAFSYFYSGGDFIRVLSVLAIATPCPLIIATPVALLAGVNNCAKNGIIVKKLENLETLSQVTTLIFDKTGTITIGKARLVDFKLRDKRYLPEQVIGITAAIERNSLHPLAKSILDYAKKKKIPIIAAQDVHEEIGKGIIGVVNGKRYRISRFLEKNDTFLSVGIFEGKRVLGVFRFQDKIKQETAVVIDFLRKLNIKIFVFTGDRKK
jgi:Cation transport ATPase